MEYTTARTISNVLFIVAVVLLLSLYLFTESAVFNIILPVVFLLAFGLFAVGIIVHVRYYRCPHCHNRIRAWGRTPDFCPECGEAI